MHVYKVSSYNITFAPKKLEYYNINETYFGVLTCLGNYTKIETNSYISLKIQIGF